MSEQMIQFPTSSDIYLEANGKKIAVVQNYRSVSTRTEKTIEASDGISFYDLEDFSLVIVKPDRRVVYTGCNWSRIAETGQLSETVAEEITLVAAKRVETPA